MRLGLFLYSLSFFFRRESISLRFDLFIIVAIALLHKNGMSSRLGGSESCSTSLACVWFCFVCCGSVVVIALVFDLGSEFFAVFLRRVMV